MDKKTSKPVAVCKKCGSYYSHTEAINQNCSKTINGNRCKGTNRSALHPDDWEECPTCHATGREKGGLCTQCDGVGWRYVRKY